jgi:phospholipase C
MWPIVVQVVEKLRGDGDNPVPALDGWLLPTLEKQPPSSVHDLATSGAMRMGPGGKGPELSTDQLAIWVRDATERALIEAKADADPAAPRWVLTAAGRERAAVSRSFKARSGRLLGRVVGMPTVWAHAVERLREQLDVDTAKPPPRREGLPAIARSRGDEEISPEQALANLEQVEHIVVLMMENRSFDHMLGYLDLLDGQSEVRGLSHARPIHYEGQDYPPEYLPRTWFPKSMDPPHGRHEIAKQINGGAMDGFIESFARAKDVLEPQRVMGYYTHRELPVYDHLAHNFLLCDQWYSSVPSATWANRVFSVAGTCDPAREGLFDGEKRFYDMESFVRLLEGGDSPDVWRWYSWDPGSLRFIDERYQRNILAGFHHDNFRRVAQHAIEPGDARDAAGDPEIRLGTGLLQDAANGDLPRVAWIDPNFVDLSILDSNSNDDHPPSDVRAGQELVMLVYRALAESPRWEKTMLVVTYDEHGGFFDHEPPPAPPEDSPLFDTYGVRVPAFVISPLVDPATVSHTVFDHTSLTRTILERFGVEGAVAKMAEKAPRVARAEHLGRLLTRTPAEGEGPPDFAQANAALEAWRHGRANRRSAAAPELTERSRDPAEWKPQSITGFPADYLTGARALREGEGGLPAGHP